MHPVLQRIIESEAVAALTKLHSWNRVRALALLSNLVTQEGTRDVVSEENLIEETRRNPLMWILRGNWPRLIGDLLGKTGLIRRSWSSGNTYYELNSEFLIPWIQKQQKAFRRVALVIWGYVFGGVLLLLVLVGYIAFVTATQQAELKRALEETEMAKDRAVRACLEGG